MIDIAELSICCWAAAMPEASEMNRGYYDVLAANGA